MRVPPTFDRFRQRAARLVADRPRLARLLGQAGRKLARDGQASARGLRRDLTLLVDLVRAWLSGEYRDVSASTLVSVVAAILYFVVPLDAIPDFIVGWGFLDDVAVIGYVMSLVREELDRFEQWRARVAAEDGDASKGR